MWQKREESTQQRVTGQSWICNTSKESASSRGASLHSRMNPVLTPSHGPLLSFRLKLESTWPHPVIRKRFLCVLLKLKHSWRPHFHCPSSSTIKCQLTRCLKSQNLFILIDILFEASSVLFNKCEALSDAANEKYSMKNIWMIFYLRTHDTGLMKANMLNTQSGLRTYIWCCPWNCDHERTTSTACMCAAGGRWNEPALMLQLLSFKDLSMHTWKESRKR